MSQMLSTNIERSDSGVVETGNLTDIRQRIAEMKNVAIDNDAAYKEIQLSADEFVRNNSYETEQKLAQVLEKYNLLLYSYPYKETSRAKKDVARMAFNGFIDTVYRGQLSKELADPINDSKLKKQESPDKYDLKYSTVWNVFKNVPEFAAIEDKIKAGLSKIGVDPQKISALKVKDFCYIINEELGGNDFKRGQVKVFNESYKAKHTKRFIRENEDEFRRGMLDMLKSSQTDKDKEVLRKLTEIEKDIVAKNRNLSQEQLKEKMAMAKNELLRDMHVNNSDFKNIVNFQKKNEEYVDRLVSVMKQGRTDLSNDKDEHGKPLWERMPVIDVHHIVNIKDAASKGGGGKSFANINDYENMCFIVRHPQHDAMHALENDLNGNNRNVDFFYNRKIDKSFIYRIQPPPGVKCMFGFNSMIYDDNYLKDNNLTKETSKNHAKEDKNYHKNSKGRHDAFRKENKYKNNYVRF